MTAHGARTRCARALHTKRHPCPISPPRSRHASDPDQPRRRHRPRARSIDRRRRRARERHTRPRTRPLTSSRARTRHTHDTRRRRTRVTPRPKSASRSRQTPPRPHHGRRHHARQPQRTGDDRERVEARDGACDVMRCDRERANERANERSSSSSTREGDDDAIVRAKRVERWGRSGTYLQPFRARGERGGRDGWWREMRGDVDAYGCARVGGSIDRGWWTRVGRSDGRSGVGRSRARAGRGGGRLTGCAYVIRAGERGEGDSMCASIGAGDARRRHGTEGTA